MTDTNSTKPELSQAKQEMPNRLKLFPITFFAIVMGLSGFTLVWEKVGHVMESYLFIDSLLALVTVAMFILISVIYLKKVMTYPDAVMAEAKHPVKLSFFPAASISMLLLSIVMLHRFEGLAHLLWLLGTALHFVLFLYIVNSWMHHDHYKIQHISPAWFIPAVGNVLVPIAGVQLGYMSVSWFFFSIGMIFWLILFIVFFYRIMFHNPLPIHLTPTFFILIAPPAVGFLAYIKLNGGSLDNFGTILYNIGLFLTILLFSQYKRFSNLPFFLSWWAYSFPLTAITLASFVMYDLTQLTIYLSFAILFLVIVNIVIGVLLYKTYYAIKNKQLCVEAH